MGHRSHEQYIEGVLSNLQHVFRIAEEARAKGLDPTPAPETLLTTDLAERVEKSVGPPGISKRLRELKGRIPREELAVKIAEEIALSIMMEDKTKAAEQAVRSALAVLDEGMTVAPIEGIHQVNIRRGADSSTLAIYYASPIRAAGGTDMGLTVVIGDYVRRILGLDPYRATEVEAKRFIEEARLYEREVARFQFKASDEELATAIRNLPVEVNGVATDQIEVTSFRNIPRIETNRVRAGALLVVNDGILGRGNKLINIIDRLGISGWDWLKDLKAKSTGADEPHQHQFLEDVVAGRPIFSFPGAIGGFRLRYGRARNTGLAALGIHPATMRVLGDFIATGTQLRIETPGKAGIAVPVDGIEPPIVKLRDGSVLAVENENHAAQLAQNVDRILFLGDVLIGYGEFLENNRPLAPSGIVEEWWASMVRDCPPAHIEKTERSEELMNCPEHPPSPAEALEISLNTGVPLHPKYTYLWPALTGDECLRLRELLLKAKHDRAQGKLSRIIADPECKPFLERLWVPHRMIGDRAVIEEAAPILDACLSLKTGEAQTEPMPPLDLIRELSGIKVLHKAPTFVGARMGRPEKADRRAMRPPVHSLFPIGQSGGKRRELLEAIKRAGPVSVEIVRRRCPQCGPTYLQRCPVCATPTELEYLCKACQRPSPKPQCECGGTASPYEAQLLDMKTVVKQAIAKLGVSTIPNVKCIRGLVSSTRIPEPIEKGILRARHNITVFKDGTTRFDCTNAPLTHFKPHEIGTTCGRLKELGYLCDSEGKGLEKPDQLCTLRVHDIVLPKRCGEYLFSAANFIDDLLTKFYGLPAHYNLSKPEDLVGQLMIGLSPHTSVGVLGRIIGFSDANVCYAHPLWHATKRRDCDGDEDSLSLALDVLINFSRAFLPERIGGLMDAPLLLTTQIRSNELPRQALNIEVAHGFPAAFYNATWQRADPTALAGTIDTISSRIARGDGFEEMDFTHLTANINSGNHESSYKKPASMLDKMARQLELAEKICAVNARDVARKVLSTHFIRDITGNLKAFSSQRFRCEKCSAKLRRIPLAAKCPRCGGGLNLTVYRGTIEKYVEAARDLVNRYDLGTYNKQSLELLKREIESLFAKGESKVQRQLADFV